MSQRSMNAASFVSAGTSITPARCIGWLATTPTASPSIRARQQSTLAPYFSAHGWMLSGVEDRLEHLAHVVAAPRVARHEREQLLGVARGRRGGVPAGAGWSAESGR